MDLTNNIEWKDKLAGGTPINAENLNKINRDVKASLEKLEQEIAKKEKEASSNVEMLPNNNQIVQESLDKVLSKIEGVDKINLANLMALGKYKISVLKYLPSAPASDTIYFICPSVNAFEF